jgi:hypothetical protein
MYGDTTMIRRFVRWSPTLAAVAAGLLFLSAPQGARATLMFEVIQPDFDFNNGSVIPVNGSIGPVHNVLFVDQTFSGSNPFTPQFVLDPGGVQYALQLPDQDGRTGFLGTTATSPNATQVGSFLVSGSVASTNSPGATAGGLTVASIQTSSFSVVNNSGAEHSQYIRVGDTGFTQPTGNVQWSYVVGGTLNGTGAVTNWAWDVTDNKQLGGTGASPFGTNNPATNTAAAITLVAGLPYSSFPASGLSGTTNVGAGPYAKTLEFDVTLGAGSSLIQRSNLLSNINTTAVPEPGSMALAFSGLSVLGLVGWRRLGRKSAS